MTNGQEKSDLFIVAMKLAKKPWAIGRGVSGAREGYRSQCASDCINGAGPERPCETRCTLTPVLFSLGGGHCSPHGKAS
jgi:hypothetical protein